MAARRHKGAPKDVLDALEQRAIMTDCSADAASTKLARAEVGRPGLQTEANSTDFSLRPSLRLFMAQERVENPRLHILLVHTADKFLSASAFGGRQVSVSGEILVTSCQPVIVIKIQFPRS